MSTLGAFCLLYSMQPAELCDLLFIPAGKEVKVKLDITTPLIVNI